MNGKQILQQAFAEHTAETGTRVVDHAFLTRGPGTGKLVVNAVTRRVYYYQLTATGDVRATGTAVVSTALYIDFVDDTRYENQMVDLGYEPGDPDTLKVLRLNNTFGIAGVGGVTPGEQAIHASNFPSSANIVDLRSQPTAPASSEVQVSAGAYLDDIGAIELFSTDLTANATNSLTSQIATLASGKHAVCWLCLDISTGILDTVLGTPVTASGALPSRREFNSPAAFNSIAVANPLRRIVPVYLYHGQTEVVEADYYRAYDARHPFNAGISASGGSGDVIGPATATDHAAARFDGATGKLIEDSTVIISDAGDINIPGIETTQSGKVRKIRVVTAAGAVTVTTADDIISINKTVGAATTANLPATPTTGQTFVIHDGKGDAATNNITVTPAAGNINGAATLVLNIAYASAICTYNGTQWDATIAVTGSGIDTDYYQTLQVGGSAQTQRGKLNLVAGTNVTLTPADDGGSDRSNVTFDVSSASLIDSKDLFVSTASAAVTTTSPTSLFGSGVGSLTLPADFLTVGKALKLTLTGIYTTALVPPTLTITIKLGSTTIITTGAVTLVGSLTNQWFQLEVLLTCRTSGVSGTIIAQGAFMNAESTVGLTMLVLPLVETTTNTIDTTASQVVDATATLSSATGSSVTCTNAIAQAIDIENAGEGNVIGPVSSTDRAVATWSGASGQDLRDNANNTIDASGNASDVSDKITGTGGAGFAEAVAQSSDPSAPAATGLRLFADASGYLAWRIKNGSDTFKRLFNGVLTAARTYTWPDASGNVLIDTATQNASNKTITASTVDSTPIGGTTPAAVTSTLDTAGQYVLGASQAATLASDTLTLTSNKGYYILTSESSTSDNLTNIVGGSGNMFIVLKAAAGHTISVQASGTNIVFATGFNFSLTGNAKIMLMYDSAGGKWTDVSVALTNTVAQGGTGHTSLTPNALLVANASGFVINFIDPSTAEGYLLQVVSGVWTPVVGIDGSLINAGTVAAARLGVMTADSGSGGAKGAAPAPATGDAIRGLFGDATYIGTARKLVALTVLGADAANIDLTSIPTTYSSLLLKLWLRSDRAATSDNAYIRLNNDSTAANYYSYTVAGNGATVVFTSIQRLAATGTAVEVNLGAVGNTGPANEFSYLEVEIFNYASTASNRIVKISGYSRLSTAGGTLNALFGGGSWLNATTAISRLTILPVTGSNWKAGSAYMLYGLSS